MKRPIQAGGSRSSRHAARDWSRWRMARPVNSLLPAAAEWVEALPDHVRPMALVAQFPRIINLLALQGGSFAICRAYLDELLVDRRGSRKGFPEEVQHELQVLRGYYEAKSVDDSGSRQP